MESREKDLIWVKNTPSGINRIESMKSLRNCNFIAGVSIPILGEIASHLTGIHDIRQLSVMLSATGLGGSLLSQLFIWVDENSYLDPKTAPYYYDGTMNTS